MRHTKYTMLADWRRTVAEMYVKMRQDHTVQPLQAWQRFRATRDELFRSHAVTPLNEEQKKIFDTIKYYPYNPAWRVIGQITSDFEKGTFEVDLGGDGLFRYTRAGRVQFTIENQEVELSLFWIEGYGGGIFLPFQDTTSNQTTYGGGRYLYDTIKGADLGMEENKMVLDFNYSYNPSCSYNDLWICPLSPPENRLSLAVEAGEMMSEWILS